VDRFLLPDKVEIKITFLRDIIIYHTPVFLHRNWRTLYLRQLFRSPRHQYSLHDWYCQGFVYFCDVQSDLLLLRKLKEKGKSAEYLKIWQNHKWKIWIFESMVIKYLKTRKSWKSENTNKSMVMGKFLVLRQLRVLQIHCCSCVNRSRISILWFVRLFGRNSGAHCDAYHRWFIIPSVVSDGDIFT